jgi:magnesium transporter
MITTFLLKSSQVSKGGIEQISAWKDDPLSTLWVDLTDAAEFDDPELHKNNLGLHPMAVQDARRDRHPAKIEAFDEFTFLLLKGLSADSFNIDFKTIQLSLFVGKRFMLTFHCSESISIERLKTMLLEEPVTTQASGTTLAMRLCRLMSMRYINILLELEPRLEELEALMLNDDANDTMLSELIRYKSDLKRLHRYADYHEQMFQQMKDKTFPGLDQVKGKHEIIDVWEKLERTKSLSRLFYETASDLIEGYISVASHRLNQIMKVLTVVMAIFVPLSFLAGIYGMNFENIPELHHPSGYFILLTVMGSIVGFLLMLFRKKRWL